MGKVLSVKDDNRSGDTCFRGGLGLIPAIFGMPKLYQKLVTILTIVVLVLFLAPVSVLTQEEEPEEEFVNWGYISVSPKFTLGGNVGFIVFPIKNNTSRSIRSIHAWVYELLQDESGAETYRLANNPNIGGLLFKEKFHSPGAVADWRFSLLAANRPAGGEPKFTFRVSHRGIFFARIEPPPKPAAQ